VGCSVAVLCRLALERSKLKTETSAHHWSELSTCYLAATSRMFFNKWYTLLTPSVEGTGELSKSVAAVATFWLAQAKVGCCIPSWLMVAVTGLARAQDLVMSMVAARSVPSTTLRRCSSVSWASRAACSLASSSCC
jgi:hypothetical protein